VLDTGDGRSGSPAAVEQEGGDALEVPDGHEQDQVSVERARLGQSTVLPGWPWGRWPETMVKGLGEAAVGQGDAGEGGA
jgi:hypothetical protein